MARAKNYSTYSQCEATRNSTPCALTRRVLDIRGKQSYSERVMNTTSKVSILSGLSTPLRIRERGGETYLETRYRALLSTGNDIADARKLLDELDLRPFSDRVRALAVEIGALRAPTADARLRRQRQVEADDNTLRLQYPNATFHHPSGGEITFIERPACLKEIRAAIERGAANKPSKPTTIRAYTVGVSAGLNDFVILDPVK